MISIEQVLAAAAVIAFIYYTVYRFNKWIASILFLLTGIGIYSVADETLTQTAGLLIITAALISTIWETIRKLKNT